MSSTTVTHNVTAEEFDRMPKARSFQGIALTAPSVNSGDIEGGFQVNGASGAENSFTVDGVTTNSLVNGKSRQDTVFEYLQEVQVKTAGIEAEYGGALGGVISAVTKSGGNVFRGEAHYYYDGNGLAAGPVKRLVLDPIQRHHRVVTCRTTSRRTTRNEVGGSHRRSDRERSAVLLRLVLAALHPPRPTTTPIRAAPTHGLAPSEIAPIMQAFGKVTYSTGKLQANASLLLTPTRVDRHAARLQRRRHRSTSRSSLAGERDPDDPSRLEAGSDQLLQRASTTS